MNINSLLGPGIFVIVVFILNAVILGVIFFTQRKMNAISEWSQIMGTVLMSTTQSRRNSDGSGGYTSYPVVMYSYQAGGQTHQGNTIAPGPQVGGSGAGKVVARYPIGSQVVVYYNPQNPAEAVLEKKAPAQFWLWFILIIFDCVLCGVLPVRYFMF